MTTATAQMETWETTSASQVVVNRYDKRGGEKGVVVGGQPGKRIQLTTEEREGLNEEMAADPGQDIFQNGMLRPVRGVPEDIVMRFETQTKVHGGLNVEELLGLLETKTGNEFKNAVDALSEATLRRLADLAPEADATSSQMQAIEEALAKFKVQIRETEADRINRSGPSGRAAE